MFTPVDKFSLGISFSKIFVSSSNTAAQNTYRRQGIVRLVSVDTNGDGVVDSNVPVSDEASLPDGQSSTSVKRKFPTQVNLGVAWFPSPSLLLSADIDYFTEVKDQGVEQVTNFAIGSEYYLSKNWAMRAGFYTNFANTPQLSDSGVNQNEHIDLYGLTGSVSHFTRNTSVTLGAGYTFGKGKAQIIGQQPGDIPRFQDADSQGWMIFLSSSYSY
jgi:long-chain fatty acid transport protein